MHILEVLTNKSSEIDIYMYVGLTLVVAPEKILCEKYNYLCFAKVNIHQNLYLTYYNYAIK